MRTLKRSECSVLTLVLKGKWYDMIASGVKREEYREIKPYWNKRICGWLERKGRGVVAFSRGYCTPDMFFLGDYCICSAGGAVKRDWGEPTSFQHWVIGLGERINLED